MESYEAFASRREREVQEAVTASIVNTIFSKLSKPERLAELFYDLDIPEDFVEDVAAEFDRLYQIWTDEEC